MSCALVHPVRQQQQRRRQVRKHPEEVVHCTVGLQGIQRAAADLGVLLTAAAATTTTASLMACCITTLLKAPESAPAAKHLYVLATVVVS
jgi:hypothetical protein